MDTWLIHMMLTRTDEKQHANKKKNIVFTNSHPITDEVIYINQVNKMKKRMYCTDYFSLEIGGNNTIGKIHLDEHIFYSGSIWGGCNAIGDRCRVVKNEQYTLIPDGVIMGNDCLFDDGVTFSHNCKFGNGCVFTGHNTFGEHPVFGDNCIFGDGCRFEYIFGRDKPAPMAYPYFGKNCIFIGSTKNNKLVEKHLNTKKTEKAKTGCGKLPDFCPVLQRSQFLNGQEYMTLRCQDKDFRCKGCAGEHDSSICKSLPPCSDKYNNHWIHVKLGS